MSLIKRSRKNRPETEEQSCSETETGNPSIRRADGAYRSLDDASMERIRKRLRKTRPENPDRYKHEIEFWREHGLDRMSK